MDTVVNRLDVPPGLCPMVDRPGHANTDDVPQSIEVKIGSAQSESGLGGIRSSAAAPNSIRVGLIDCLRFSRDCLVMAFGGFYPELSMVPFDSVSACIGAAAADLDLILYYSHHDSSFEALAMQHIKSLRQAFGDMPIVILSDAKTALQPRNIRNALNCGAQGFIPTVVTEVPAALAAIRFVKDGGT